MLFRPRRWLQPPLWALQHLAWTLLSLCRPLRNLFRLSKSRLHHRPFQPLNLLNWLGSHPPRRVHVGVDPRCVSPMNHAKFGLKTLLVEPVPCQLLVIWLQVQDEVLVVFRLQQPR